MIFEMSNWKSYRRSGKVRGGFNIFVAESCKNSGARNILPRLSERRNAGFFLASFCGRGKDRERGKRNVAFYNQ